jgi:membrane protein DedA with SNARE-associated domain
LEDIILRLGSLEPLLICSVVFAIAFIENIFPPSPSDVVVLFAGSLVGLGLVGFPFILLSATAGSCLGFVAAYKIGSWFGRNYLEAGRIKFLPVESLKKAEHWFGRYGYWIIVANRFLAGTRAVVSFFAGMSGLNLLKTTILCFVSALVWNTVLVSLGFTLGKNWQQIGFYLATYTKVVTLIILAGLLALIVWGLIKSKRGASP